MGQLVKLLFVKLLGIDTWGLSIAKSIRFAGLGSDLADRRELERETIEAMCGGQVFVPWYILRRGNRPNAVALSLLNAGAPPLGTEILGVVGRC